MFSVVFVSFHWFDKKSCFHQIKTFPQDLSIFKLVEKKITFRVILCFFLRLSFFDPREMFSVNFCENDCKHPSKLGLTESGTF